MCEKLDQLTAAYFATVGKPDELSQAKTAKARAAIYNHRRACPNCASRVYASQYERRNKQYWQMQLEGVGG